MRFSVIINLVQESLAQQTFQIRWLLIFRGAVHYHVSDYTLQSSKQTLDFSNGLCCERSVRCQWGIYRYRTIFRLWNDCVSLDSFLRDEFVSGKVCVGLIVYIPTDISLVTMRNQELKELILRDSTATAFACSKSSRDNCLNLLLHRGDYTFCLFIADADVRYFGLVEPCDEFYYLGGQFIVLTFIRPLSVIICRPLTDKER